MTSCSRGANCASGSDGDGDRTHPTRPSSGPGICQLTFLHAIGLWRVQGLISGQRFEIVVISEMHGGTPAIDTGVPCLTHT